jgi:phospholipid N-methyltransferase
VPSSLGLAELMVEDMGLAAAATVVELGPGTGVFTRVIAERVRPDALVLAFEIDGTLARELQQQMPRVRVVNDSAEHWATSCGRAAASRPTRSCRACPGRTSRASCRSAC